MIDKILEQVTNGGNIDKGALFALASQIKSSDLKDERQIRNIIQQVSVIAGKEINEDTMQFLVNKIQNEGIPSSISSLLK